MAKETLTVDMRANDQLTPALEKAGKAAKQTADEVKKITGAEVAGWGRDMMRAASTLATGLYGLAKSSSDVAEAQNFTNAVFEDAAPAIMEYAESAATSIGLSEAAALDAASSLGIFGQRIELTGGDLAKFSTDLVTLAGDMASIKNTRVEDAVTAIAAAMRNEYEPIRRYGVVLNDVVLKARSMSQGLYDGTGQLTQQQKIIAVNAELYDQLGFAMGDFMRTSDEMANQTRIAQAQFENLKANLGDSLRPAFITLTGAANDALGILQKIPAPVKAIGASLGLMTVGALGFGGAALFAIGKIGDMISQIRDLKARLDATRASGGRFTNSLLSIGKLAGGIALAATATEVLGQAFNQATDVAGKTKTAIEEITIAMAKMDTKGAVQAFADLVKVENEQFKFSGLWEDFGRTFNITSLGIKGSIENLDDAWGKLTIDQQSQMIQTWEKLLPTLDKGSQEYEDLSDIIDRYAPKVETAVQAMQAQGATGELSAETMEKFGDSTLDAADAQKALEDALRAEEKAAIDMVEAIQETVDWFNEMKRGVQEATRAFDTGGEKAEAFADALERTTGTPQMLDNVVAIKDGIFGLSDAWKDADGNIDLANATLDLNTAAGRNNIRAVDDLASTIRDELNRVYEETGGNVDAVTKSAEGWRSELIKQLDAVGLNQQQIGEYLELLNLTPESIETAVKLRDQEVARQKLEMLNLEMERLPDEVRIAMLSEMDEGDFESSYQLAKNFIYERPLTFGMQADDPTTEIVEGLNSAQVTADGKPITATIDSDVDEASVYTANDAIQDALDARPTSVDVEAKVSNDQVNSQWEAIDDALNAKKPTTEVDVKKGNADETQDKINSNFERDNPETKVDVKPGNAVQTWSMIARFYNSNPVTTKANVAPGDITSTWAIIWLYYLANPVTTKANVAVGNMTGAWSDIQNYYSNHPVTVRVNTVQGTNSYVAPPPYFVPTSTASTDVMGRLGAPPAVTAGSHGAAHTSSPMNVTVNMPYGTSEARVVDLIRNYQRSNGRGSMARR